MVSVSVCEDCSSAPASVSVYEDCSSAMASVSVCEGCSSVPGCVCMTDVYVSMMFTRVIGVCMHVCLLACAYDMCVTSVCMLACMAGVSVCM